MTYTEHETAGRKNAVKTTTTAHGCNASYRHKHAVKVGRSMNYNTLGCAAVGNQLTSTGQSRVVSNKQLRFIPYSPSFTYLSIRNHHVFVRLCVIDSGTGHTLTLFHCPAAQRLLIRNLHTVSTGRD